MSCCEKILKAAATTTGCVCDPKAFPFICERHGGCEKTQHFHKLCRSHIGIFGTYEAGDKNLCINPPRAPGTFRFGLGDLVHYAVKAATFGLWKPTAKCGCHSRRVRWNRFQLWPIRWPWGKR